MLDGDLRPVVQHRNKIAHAQPLWQLKSGSEDQFKTDSHRIQFGDYWDLKHRAAALQSIGEIVLTLVVSQPTFERDFEQQVTRFHQAKVRLKANSDSSQYEEFVRSLSKPRIRSADDTAD